MTFIFDKKILIKLNNNINDNDPDISWNFSSNKIFRIDNQLLNALENNHRQSYKNIAKNIKNNETNIFELEKYPNDFIILNNVIISQQGIIITQSNDVYINGGCLCQTNNNYNFNSIINNIKKYDSVISITALWSEGIWHFPSEAFSSLKALPENILYDETIMIHVTKKTNYILSWFDLININHNRIIEGNIFSKNTYLPRMGKCGNPYLYQINWLSKVIKNNLLKNNYSDNNEKYVIIIKRTKKRQMINYITIEQIITNYCNKNNKKLYIHSDENLPSLVEQHYIFNKAEIVFATHGAGGIHLLAMNPNTYFIEFINSNDINICYSRLAYFSNINYIGISMNNNNANVNNLINTLYNLNI